MKGSPQYALVDSASFHGARQKTGHQGTQKLEAGLNFCVT